MPVSGPVAARPIPATPGPPAISDGWRHALSAWLQAHKTYPYAARMAGEAGRVVVRFTVQQDGQVTQVAVVRSSGFSSLDDAAVAMLQNARLPAFDTTSPAAPRTVTVPIVYQIDP